VCPRGYLGDFRNLGRLLKKLDPIRLDNVEYIVCKHNVYLWATKSTQPANWVVLDLNEHVTHDPCGKLVNLIALLRQITK